MSKSDPVRSNYYSNVERAEKASDLLFLLSALLSFAVLFVDKTTPRLYQGMNVVFTACVLASFICGLALRLYLIPRAEQARRGDFFSTAFDVGLTVERTDGYYNNAFVEPFKRTAAQLFENTLFTKAITGKMAVRERIKVAMYFGAWLVCLLWRDVEIGIVVAACQAVFSEQMLSKLLRLEWLRIQSERVYDKMQQLFQSTATKTGFMAITLDALLIYETAKANASITFPSKLFDKMNPCLTEQWTRTQATFGIP
jgi:hypothetical protein